MRELSRTRQFRYCRSQRSARSHLKCFALVWFLFQRVLESASHLPFWTWLVSHKHNPSKQSLGLRKMSNHCFLQFKTVSVQKGQMKAQRFSVRTVAYLARVQSSFRQECKGKSPLFCWSPAVLLKEPFIPALCYFNGAQHAQCLLCSETETRSQPP